MLTQEQETKLFDISDAFKHLYYSGGLNPVLYAIRMWNNYELHLVAEISEINEEDIVKIAEDIVNKRKTESDSKIGSRIVIAKIDHTGIELFPFDEGQKTMYKEYHDREFNKLLESIPQMSEIDQQEIIDAIKAEIGKKNKQEIILSFNSPLSIDHSTFYYINELIAKMFSGGMWEDAVDWAFMTRNNRDDWEESIFAHDDILNIINGDNSIKNYIEAVLNISDNEQLKERIVSIHSQGCTDLIDYKNRGFHDGKNYCPLRMKERIEQLVLPIKIKAEIEKIFEFIESIELLEMKIGVVNAFLNKSQEMGLMEEYHGLEDIYGKLLEVDKKVDASAFQVKTRIDELIDLLYKQHDLLSSILGTSTPPVFLNKLKKSEKQLYVNILFLQSISIGDIDTEEAKAKFIDIISLLGKLVGNIITSVLKPIKYNDITIANFQHRETEITLNNTDKYSIDEYCVKYGKLFNKRHTPPDEVIMNSEITRSFIKDSHAVLEIILKYRE
jgi:hypothetical protein